MKCLKCGQEMPERSNYCGSCGTKLRQGEYMMEYYLRKLATLRARKTTVRRKAVGNLI